MSGFSNQHPHHPKVYPHIMQITLNIPEELAARIIPAGKDPAQAALELLAVEGYRTHRLAEGEVRRLLGYETPMEVHALLKEHDVYLHYSMDDFEQDIRTADAFHAERQARDLQRAG
jgi:predicted HTH domain antitoxin